MKIDSIRLVNYRCHKDLPVKFSSGFNVLVGANGSGKTSILKGLRDCIGGLTMYFNLRHGQSHPFQDPADARISVADVNDRRRFEPCYPIELIATGQAFGTRIEWSWKKSGSIDQPLISGNPPGTVWVSQRPLPNSSDETLHKTLPIAVFYSANRRWLQGAPSELEAATERHARADGYERWWDASLDSSALAGWMISKSLERMQTSSELGILFDSVADDELSLVNSALAGAIDGLKGLRYDMKQRGLLVEWNEQSKKRTVPTLYENLSDGQRAVISLVADIARRMCLLNPHLGNDVLKNTPGIVLIDELDMHLHPKWQRMITNGLKTAFPEVQFIVASHSPQILGELTPEEIILLSPLGITHPKVSYGVDSSRVLEEIMGASSRPLAIEEKLSNLFIALERNQLDSAREQLEELKKEAPGLAEITGAAALLKRREIIGK